VEGEGGEGAEDQEENVLEDDGLLGEAAEVGGFGGRGGGGGFFDACPGEVDVEEEEEDAEADDGALGWLEGCDGGGWIWETCIELVVCSHQGVVEEMSIDLVGLISSGLYKEGVAGCRTYLRLDQDQINEKHNKIMLNVFIAEPPAVLAHSEAHAMACRLVICARVLCVQSLHWIPAFYTDRHGGDPSSSTQIHQVVAQIMNYSW
jgi:hypothetical protein